MDYRLVYTQKALNDLAEIVGHIAEDDAQVASRFGSSLISHVELLTDFPAWVAWFGSGLPSAKSYTVHTSSITASTMPNAKSKFSTSATGRGNRQCPRCARNEVDTPAQPLPVPFLGQLQNKFGLGRAGCNYANILLVWTSALANGDFYRNGLGVGPVKVGDGVGSNHIIRDPVTQVPATIVTRRFAC